MFRLLLIEGLLCCTIFGCYSRDNPADPGRCDPACGTGKICWEGVCRAGDGGPGTDQRGDALGDNAGGSLDQLADGTPAATSIFYKKCKGSAATQTSAPSSTILCDDGELSVKVMANGTDKYLFILNLPDTWLDACKLGSFTYHCHATFELKDGNDSLTTTGYTAPHGQHLPVTLVATKVLSAGEHTIEARWGIYGSNGGVLKHQGYPGWLVVIRADPQDLQGSYGPASSQSLGASQDWTDLSIPSLTIPKPGGDYLLLLTTTPTMAGANAGIQYRLRRQQGGTDLAIGHANVIYSAGAAGQTFPVTLLEATNLQGGDVVRAQWKNYSGAKVEMIPVGGTVNASWLAALRTPRGIFSRVRTTEAEKSTTSTSPVAVPDLPLLEVASTGGRHLLAFGVTMSRTCAYAPYYAAGFQLHVGGALELGGTFSAHGNSNLMTCQTIPMTLFGVRELAAGKHNLGAEWYTSGAPFGDNGRLFVGMAKLLALTR